MMKDIVIRGRDIRREAIVWACCVVVLTAVNALAIAKHGTSWSELYSLWYVILPLSVLLYVVLLPLRWLGRLLWKAVRRAACRKECAKA